MSQFTSIEMNLKEVNNALVYNLLKMINKRNDLDDIESTFDKLKETISTNTNIDFKGINNKYSIYIINAKLNSILSKSPLDEYLNKNLEVHKFVIVREGTKKVVKQIRKEYKNCEFFFVDEMLEDIPSKIFIPKHILLDDSEKTLLLEKFNLGEFSKIYDTDMMSRYYNAKPNDIFKIIRTNLTCGKSIFYRVVIPGKVDRLF